MSIRIPLHFLTHSSASNIPSTPLLAWVSLKTLEDELPPMEAIVDIGSPVSLIPFRIWGQAQVTMGERSSISFFSDRPECELGVTHGEVTISLFDEDGNRLIKDFTLPTDLCDTSEMPFILGMYGFLSLGGLFMKEGTGEAWLEFPDSVLTDSPPQEEE